MSETIVIKAELRIDKGTRASRRLRRSGKIPGIIYGNNIKEITITVDHRDILVMTEKNNIVDNNIIIVIGDKNERTKIKALQRHPFKSNILHIDFIRN